MITVKKSVDRHSTSSTKCKHFGFVNKTLVQWRLDNSQTVRRQTSTKVCGVCRGTFEMSGSIAIRPLRACCVTVVCQGMRLPVGNLCLISIGDSVFDIRSDC